MMTILFPLNVIGVSSVAKAGARGIVNPISIPNSPLTIINNVTSDINADVIPITNYIIDE